MKAKQQSIEAIAEVSKSINRKGPFKTAPHSRPNWGQKFRSNYNDKYILFQKKGTLVQQQPNFTSSHDKHEGINSCLSNSKNIIFQTKSSKMCPSREDKGTSPSLETTDIRSRALDFSRRLTNSSSNGTSAGDWKKLGRSSISKVCHSKREFLSSLFLISKKGGGSWPVINLKDLNRLIPYKHLKMEDLHCLKYVLQKSDDMCKIDLKDAYFSVHLHVQMHPKKAGGLYVEGSEQGFSGPRKSMIYISISRDC